MSNEEYSGRFSVRVPKDLHRALNEQAKAENVSLNLYINMLLTSGVVVGAFTEALFRDAREAIPADRSFQLPGIRKAQQMHAEGYSNLEISRTLCVGESTVEDFLKIPRGL